MHLTILDGLDEEYGNNVLLKLLAPVHGLWNASMLFLQKIKENYENHSAQAKFGWPMLVLQLRNSHSKVVKLGR